MLGGKGFYRGSSILLSGTAGTGKSSVSASFVNAACGRGEQALYISYEEPIADHAQYEIHRHRSPEMAGEGEPPVSYHPRHHARPGGALFLVKELIEETPPVVVVIDPVSNLLQLGSPEKVKNQLTRLIDLRKSSGISTLVTELISGGSTVEATNTDISSLMEAWIRLREMETGGERTRVLSLLKARGMAHSHQLREFVLTDEGVSLLDVYSGPAGLITGTARYTQEAQEEAEHKRRLQEIECMVKETRLKEIEAKLQGEEEKLEQAIREAEEEEDTYQQRREMRRQLRGGR
ncbi:MAG: ATPase domain-containing protein [Desulfohalobiaceae bacterium]